MPETNLGIYKTRTGNNGETLIHLRKTENTHYWIYHDEETGIFRMVPAK